MARFGPFARRWFSRRWFVRVETRELASSTLAATKLAVLTLAMVAPPLGGLQTARAERFAGSLAPDSTVRYAASAGWERFAGVAPLQLDRFELDDAALPSLRLEVRVATAAFSTGNIFRDLNARRVAFESRLHPYAVFVASGVRFDDPAGGAPDGRVPGLPDGSSRGLTLLGTLRLHGVRRPLEVPLTVRRQGRRVEVTGGFTVTLSDFEIQAPSILGRSVDQLVTVEIDATVQLVPP